MTQTFIPNAPQNMELPERLAWRAGYRVALEDQPYREAISGLAENIAHIVIALDSQAEAIKKQSDGLLHYHDWLIKILEEGPETEYLVDANGKHVEAYEGVEGMSEPPGQ
jgi:hypothetical protein